MFAGVIIMDSIFVFIIPWCSCLADPGLGLGSGSDCHICTDLYRDRNFNEEFPFLKKNAACTSNCSLHGNIKPCIP